MSKRAACTIRAFAILGIAFGMKVVLNMVAEAKPFSVDAYGPPIGGVVASFWMLMASFEK